MDFTNISAKTFFDHFPLNYVLVKITAREFEMQISNFGRNFICGLQKVAFFPFVQTRNEQKQ